MKQGMKQGLALGWSGNEAGVIESRLEWSRNEVRMIRAWGNHGLGIVVWHVYLCTVASLKVSARGWGSDCWSCASGGWRGSGGSSYAGRTPERDLPLTVIHKESSAIWVLEQRREEGKGTQWMIGFSFSRCYMCYLCLQERMMTSLLFHHN